LLQCFNFANIWKGRNAPGSILACLTIRATQLLAFGVGIVPEIATATCPQTFKLDPQGFITIEAHAGTGKLSKENT